jgi:hypothetical protein
LCDLHPRPEGRGFMSQEDKPLNKKELYDLYITEMTNMQDKKPSIFSYLFYGYNMNLNFQSLSPIVYD